MLLVRHTEFGHGVHNAQESIDRLGLLADHGCVDLELQTMVFKVLLHLLAVDIVDVHVHDSKASSPAREAFCEVTLLLVKDTVDEAEVVFDLLVALDVETLLGLRNGGLHVRHFDGCAVETTGWAS